MSFYRQSDGGDQNQDQAPQSTEGEEALSKIKIGAEEYDPAEAERLMNLGKIAHEAETKYNTKIDKVWPQYQRTQSEIEKLRSEMEEVRQSSRRSTSTPEEEDFETQAQKARAAAKELGIVTKDELDSYYKTRKAEDDLISEIKGLQSQINGEDGRPAFDPEEIVYHMRETGITNPLRAYKDKYEKQLDEWRVGQIMREKRGGGFYTTQNTGPVSKAPGSRIPRSKDDLVAALAEHFGMGE